VLQVLQPPLDRLLVTQPQVRASAHLKIKEGGPLVSEPDAPPFPRLLKTISHIRSLGARATPEHDAAVKKAHQLIATELLPAILGGSWRGRTAWPLHIIRDMGREGWVQTCGLFDHPRFYRRTGYLRHHDWRAGVLVGEPYNAIKLENGKLHVLSDGTEAWRFLDYEGMDTWISTTLSPHYPGWTKLVLTSASLRGRAADASRFGFIAMSDVSRDAAA
jgi:hypothetical protein